MLQGNKHRQLISDGVAHFGGPLLIEIDGDAATAINCSPRHAPRNRSVLSLESDAVRWDLERSVSSWRVRRRTNRLLDETGAGSQLFKTTLQSLTP